MKYYYGKYINDGKLDHDCGRIVIYDRQIEVSVGRSRDHNDLLRGLAAKMLTKKDDVISHGIRLYYKREPGRIVVSPVRQVDDDEFQADWDFNRMIVKKALRRR